MAKYLKITKYKIQITMSEITNSPIGLDIRYHFMFFAEVGNEITQPGDVTYIAFFVRL
jgi:hypothetical protein